MSAWQDVALVVAGSLGPAGIAVVSIRNERRKDDVHRLREETDRRHDTYARFLAACTTIVADWSDVALTPPRSVDEERLLDQRRDEHYDVLNVVAAMVRLTAVPAVASAAEDVLAVVRDARDAGQRLASETDRAVAMEGWRGVDVGFSEARAAFVAAGRACDVRPPDDR